MFIKQENRRQFPRLKMSYPVRFEVVGQPLMANAISNNLSLGGAGLINNRFLPPRTQLKVQISLPSRILNSTARVAWSAPMARSDRYSTGVEFTDIDQKDKKYLEDFISLKRF